MIQLIIYGVIAIGALGAIYAIDKSRQAVGERRVEAKYAPIAEQCKAINVPDAPDCAKAMRQNIADRDKAVLANRSLDEQFTAFRRQHDESVKALAKESERIVYVKQAATKEAQPKLEQIALDKFNLIVSLGKGNGISCDQLDAALLEEARKRQRDYGKASAAPPPAPGTLKLGTEPEQVRPEPRNPLRK